MTRVTIKVIGRTKACPLYGNSTLGELRRPSPKPELHADPDGTMPTI